MIQTESSNKMVIFLLLNLGAIILGIYFIFLQFYVLLIEILLFAATLVLAGLDIFFGFFACWTFQSYEKQQ